MLTTHNCIKLPQESQLGTPILAELCYSNSQILLGLVNNLACVPKAEVTRLKTKKYLHTYDHSENTSALSHSLMEATVVCLEGIEPNGSRAVSTAVKVMFNLTRHFRPARDVAAWARNAHELISLRTPNHILLTNR
ncbi:unnamed protein product [Aspergillus oryzae]|nr:unnamed protein product [Aspergillus oryzae]GMF97250.1 unnamed protein product [Aspergillus oryzae]